MEEIIALHSLDEILCDFSLVKDVKGLEKYVQLYQSGAYQQILNKGYGRLLWNEFLERLPQHNEGTKPESWKPEVDCPFWAMKALIIALAAFDAFLQANVTGPPLTAASLFFGKDVPQELVKKQRKECFHYLSIAGLSVYQYIPHIELFAFAKAIFTEYFPRAQLLDTKWMRIRVNAYHQRLLSSGVSNIRLSDSVAELQAQMEHDMKELERDMMSEQSRYSTEAKVQYSLEKAQIYIMQGLDVKAKDNLKKAKDISRFSYALSGALGKRTKFQQNDISQLVVFAKSHGGGKDEQANGTDGIEGALRDADIKEEKTAPSALKLDDDTLLEDIQFIKTDKDAKSDLPAELANLEPNDQPQLRPLDQIILLTEATLKDASIASDKLTNEEILPYAVRVLNDKPTNWQVYTQALLVRSRIESHRSRTQERSVLQLQAIVDQIIADTAADESVAGADGGVPQIQVTQFFPKAKEGESAPIQERLKYIYQLNTPTRWEIETELAYAWSKTGSLVSALEIFKRLRLWAEVALCYHSIDQSERALQIIRRQLFYSKKGPQMDDYAIDAEELITEKWDGEIRSPPPPHAPRLWCILGDLEQDPSCWERAWEISGKHYARAQRTLGEYYTRQGDLSKAREAYMAATMVNRQNGDTWSRLGDIDLASGNWDGAVIAFQQAIMIDDENAKTYSNLGSALLSKYTEMIKLDKLAEAAASSNPAVEEVEAEDSDDESQVGIHKPQVHQENPRDILRQALMAYRKGASLQHDNWQIWDNVITVAGRMQPPAFAEILQAMRAIIKIRAPSIGEDAIDISILRALVQEVLSCEKEENAVTMENGIYTAPRGSLARAVPEFVDAEIVPLITKRAELWALVEKLKFYRRDYAGALSAAEKRWRIATGGEEWLNDVDAWKQAADATDGLVSAFENYGQQEKHDGSGEVEKGWRMKARSAVRGILGKAKDNWEDSEEYEGLKDRLEELKNM